MASTAPSPDLARLLGPIGRVRWLAPLLADARIGAWLPHPALRVAWIAFVLTVPGVLSTWTVLFVLRRLLAAPPLRRALVRPLRAAAAGLSLTAGARRGGPRTAAAARALPPPAPLRA